jgi:phosphate:Na+ symporter
MLKSKTQFSSLFLTVTLLLGSLFNVKADSTQIDSEYASLLVPVEVSDFKLPGFDKLEISLFKNYKDITKKLQKIGEIKVKWSSTDADQDLQVRYKFEDEESWIYSKTFKSTSGEFKLDSIDENKFGVIQIGNGNNWSAEQEFHTIGANMFKNLAVKPGSESATLTWSVDYKILEKLKDKNLKAIITYNTDLGKKRHANGVAGGDWMYTEPFDISETKYSFENLNGNDKYHFKVGISPEGDIEKNKGEKSKMIWSATKKEKTERGWGIGKLLILIGSLAFFIYGMKTMSEGLQQAAGNRLRNMLGSITSNRVKGVLSGFGITSIVQSSSVTTVMTVSFVNAGLMTLRQSAGVMMGANIGTTITGWIVLLIGFKLSIGSYAYMLIALAAPLLFVNRGKSKAWASAIFGFCILFIGLDALKGSVPQMDASSEIVQFFLSYKDLWFGPVMFVCLGALVTIVIQSSSAAMALTLTMVANGALPFEVACAMVLGENIGTTITAELASLVANVHAKRSARIHSMFNIVGVVWMLLIFPFFLKGLAMFVEGDPFTNVAVAGTTIALFHTVFNFLNVFLLIWFVPQLVSLAEKTVKSKGEADEEFKLDFIGGALGSTAELNILEAQKEVAKFGEITSRMNEFMSILINSSDKKEKSKMIKKLAKYEEITDRVEVEIGHFLGKTSRLEMSGDASLKMRGMLNITTDLERIGDIFFQMGKAIEAKEKDESWFIPSQREGINKMITKTKEAFEIMNENLNKQYGSINIDKAIEKEKEINQLRNKLRKAHLASFEEEGFNMSSAIIYNNLFSSFEKVGDHIINVSEAVSGVNLQ